MLAVLPVVVITVLVVVKALEAAVWEMEKKRGRQTVFIFYWVFHYFEHCFILFF